MKRKQLSMGIIAIVVGAFVWGMMAANLNRVSASALETPSIEFITAALKDQLSRRGNSLEADFYVEIPGQTTAIDRSIYNYIWTPNHIHLAKRNYGKGDELIMTNTLCYDVDGVRYRDLLIHRDGNRASGRDFAGFPDDLNIANLMETSCIFLRDIPLYEAIKQGSVSDKVEEIDGHACWRVDFPVDPSNSILGKWKVWLDPKVGFSPRRLELPSFNGKLRWSIVFSDYRDIGNGVWFPGKQQLTSGDRVTISVLKSAGIGRSIPKDDLNIDFPSGTRVEVGSPDDVVKMVVP